MREKLPSLRNHMCDIRDELYLFLLNIFDSALFVQRKNDKNSKKTHTSNYIIQEDLQNYNDKYSLTEHRARGNKFSSHLLIFLPVIICI